VPICTSQSSVAVTFLFERNMRLEDHQAQQPTHIAEALPPGYAVVFSRWIFGICPVLSHFNGVTSAFFLPCHPTSTLNSHTVHSPHLIMCQCSFALLWIFSISTPSTLSSSQHRTGFTGQPPQRHHFRDQPPALWWKARVLIHTIKNDFSESKPSWLLPSM